MISPTHAKNHYITHEINVVGNFCFVPILLLTFINKINLV